MKITLSHLRKGWDQKRLRKIIKSKQFVLGQDKVLDINNSLITYNIDAIWSEDFNKTLEKKRSKKIFKHIFISEICDIAVEEYATVCKLLKIEAIRLYGDKRFVDKSKKLLSKIPNIKVYSLEEK